MINIETVIDRALERGGITVHVASGNEPDSGYAVGGASASEAYTLGARRGAQLAREVRRYIAANRAQLDRPDLYLGLWRDDVTDSLYVDVTRIETDRETAIARARYSGERAIYDLAAGQEVRV